MTTPACEAAIKLEAPAAAQRRAARYVAELNAGMDGLVRVLLPFGPISVPIRRMLSRHDVEAAGAACIVTDTHPVEFAKADLVFRKLQRLYAVRCVELRWGDLSRKAIHGG